MRGTSILYDLARLLEAGLAPAEAVGRLEPGDRREARALERLGAALRRGHSLAQALDAAGLASKLDAAVIAVGEQAGRLDDALRYLARQHEQRQARVSRLRRQLWLPNVVFAIVLIVTVIRRSAAGAGWSAVLPDAGLAALLAACFSLGVVAAVKRDASAWLTFASRYGLVRASTLLRRWFEHVFLTLLEWQARSGVDFVSGADGLASLVDESRYDASIVRYRTALRGGSSVGDALVAARLMEPGEALSVIRTGEQSGRLAQSLAHYLAGEQTRLDRTGNAILAWLPRAYYVCVLLLGGAFVL